MKKKPVLVIMAAGMGSRYGGLKQIDPVDEYGNLIIDFSIYDAVAAGFEKIVFIIKKAIEEDFKEHIGKRMEQHAEVAYVYQELDKLPEGYTCPEERVKPWGTGHAILCCAEEIGDAPFAVINADDYYGKSAFKTIYDQLCSMEDDDICHYTMVSYDLYKTLTDNGHVARGVCSVDENRMLTDIVERTKIEKHGEQAEFTEDDGATWNPLKCEYFLPFVVDEMLKEGMADIKVLSSADSWYGVTYKEDKEKVMSAIRGFKEAGLYPERLWEEK